MIWQRRPFVTGKLRRRNAGAYSGSAENTTEPAGYDSQMVEAMTMGDHIPADAADAGSTDIPRKGVPYDETLLERARTQWQFGDWASLAKLDHDSIEYHPDRAKLALLAACGHMQLGNHSASRQFLRFARDWRCSKKLITQLLISGVHNSLGKAAAIVGEEQQALGHFEAAVHTGTPGAEARLFAPARISMQLMQLNLSTPQTGLLTGAWDRLLHSPRITP